VGEDRRQVNVHAEAMASLSQPLNLLVNGRMKEDREKTAAILDAELEISLRLV
jgi:hypothetical protein